MSLEKKRLLPRGLLQIFSLLNVLQFPQFSATHAVDAFVIIVCITKYADTKGINAKFSMRSCLQRAPLLAKSHYSKRSILTKNQTFSRVFQPKFFLIIFLVKSKLSTAKKSKITTFSRVFHPQKIDNFLGKSKLNFWTKKEDFEQCVFQVFFFFSSSTLALKVLWTVCKLASLSHCYAYT